MHTKTIITAGTKLNIDGKVLVMLHGRGGTAEDILSLGSYLNVKDFTLFAPQATGNTWYPYSCPPPPSITGLQKIKIFKLSIVEITIFPQ